jgi:plasmid maintenance system antidote protein VapI
VIASRQSYRTSAAVRLRAILEAEFARRRRLNPRYSLRAFARSVELEHSTLSQLLRGKRALTWRSIGRIARTMRWTGSAVLQLSAQSKVDSRDFARRLDVSVDEVNVALTDLCLFGVIELKGE